VVAVDVHEEKLRWRASSARPHGRRERGRPGEAIQALGGATRRSRWPRRRRRSSRPTGPSPGGTLVFVALPKDNHMELPIFETVLNGITVVGSIVGTRTTCARSSSSTRRAGRA
jgi:propanol-preferring alcohol dehydrogenase